MPLFRTLVVLATMLLVDACGGGESTTDDPANPADTTAPSISITSPTSDDTYVSTTNPVSLAGSASDNVGVVEVVWQSSDGQSGTASGTTSWQIDGIMLSPGDTDIEVAAIDAAGNIALDTITVSMADDTVAPTVNITSPSADGSFETTSSSVSLAGEASDDVGVAAVYWETDDGRSGTATGSTNWQIAAIPVSPGDTEITVTAEDAAGNSDTDVIVVTVIDTGVTVTIESPTSASTLATSDSEIVLAGTAASANGAIAAVTWSNSQGASGSASGTTSWTTPSIGLAVGTNTLVVTAEDDLGNSSDDTLIVTRNSSSGFSFVEGKDTTPPSASLTEPTFGDSYVDPAYGLTVRKVTDATGTRFNRNVYSRIEPENSDATLFLTYHGDAEYRVYDRQTLALVRALSDLDPQAEIQWHPTDPRRIRFTEGGNSFTGSLKLLELDIDDPPGTPDTVIVDLAGRTPWPDVDPTGAGRDGFISDGAEGSPSRDGSRYAWVVLDLFEQVVGMISVDISTDTILGTLDASQWAQFGDLDHVSMTPSGNAIVASFDDAVIAYDVDFKNPRQLHYGTEHSDIAVDAQGRDTLVIIDFGSGDLASVNVQTAQRTNLFNIFNEDTDTSIHISGKAFGKPGWAVVSTYNCRAPAGQVGWACDKVFVVELAPNPRILNLAHTYNCGADYWTEPHAAPSRDLRRVYYNSDWGSCDIDAEVMMIDVPEF